MVSRWMERIINMKNKKLNIEQLFFFWLVMSYARDLFKSKDLQIGHVKHSIKRKKERMQQVIQDMLINTN